MPHETASIRTWGHALLGTAQLQFFTLHRCTLPCSCTGWNPVRQCTLPSVKLARCHIISVLSQILGLWAISRNTIHGKLLISASFLCILLFLTSNWLTTRCTATRAFRYALVPRRVSPSQRDTSTGCVLALEQASVGVIAVATCLEQSAHDVVSTGHRWNPIFLPLDSEPPSAPGYSLPMITLDWELREVHQKRFEWSTFRMIFRARSKEAHRTNEDVLQPRIVIQPAKLPSLQRLPVMRPVTEHITKWWPCRRKANRPVPQS